MNGMSPRMKFPVAAAAAIVLLMTCTWAIADWTVATPAERARPSFDCGKAMEQAEKLVCASQELSELDEELQAAYAGALRHILPYWKRDLVKEQRNWVQYVRNVCMDSACLRGAYTARIPLLRANKERIPDDLRACADYGLESACGGVVFYRDATVRIRGFNASMRENHALGTIIGCDRLIDIAVGTAHGNHRFGGYCTLRTGDRTRHVAICDDVMIGRFAIAPTSVAQQSDGNLVQFTAENCPGG